MPELLEPQYNLVDEPWIPVIMPSGERRLVGLREALEAAGEIETLACELRTQDFAVLRLLLAIVRRALDWFPVQGRDLRAEWADMWTRGELPPDMAEYLTHMHDRFWLLGGQRPFCQVPDLTYTNTNRDAGEPSDLIADVPPGHKMFVQRTAPSWAQLEPAEAALWLIHAHAYDPSGIRSGVMGDPTVKKGKSYPIGTGWCGSLGGLFVEADTLARTLLCNLPPGPDALAGTDADDAPAWESTRAALPPAKDGREPTGPIDVLTWQSRRIRLIATRGHIDGVVLTNGDRLTPQNRFPVEYMTAWRRSPAQEKKLRLPLVYMPRAHQPERSLWRGLSAILAEPDQGDGPHLPARTITWLEEMRAEGHLPQDARVTVKAAGICYGANEATVAELVGDSLEFRVSVLTGALRHAVVAAATEADDAAQAAGRLFGNLHLAAGGDPQTTPFAAGREQAFARLDQSFRTWLAGLSASSDVVQARTRWQGCVRSRLEHLASQWLQSAGSGAWVGREVRGRWLSAPIAEIWFNLALRKALPLANPAKEETQHD